MLSLTSTLSVAALLLAILGTRLAAAQKNFNFVNKCGQTVWAGTQPNSGKPVLSNGGFTLGAGQSSTINAASDWAGRFWGRTGCSFDSSGQGSCLTGDCGNVLACNGAGGNPPATLVEITLGSKDFYDVSLVDGFNLPVRISPIGGSGDCRAADCVSNVNGVCPSQLQVTNNGQVVACQSACGKFNLAQYCCTGSNNTPSTCPPTSYSKVFKNACPNAYSYAYDDASSTFTCSGPSGYTITFCP
ncbi:hypothetical protein O6H91_11G095800 [Diphasiastrum complanatum]|uniref:Uncharacterized protein n=2 Tax=Diphasiastrum complanatum TaxID=34168 RepID=A0ACC2CBU1_DIPCM|nr:hypothetical protein O6H91_11G095000 [Diphasiastrum complanatum]KAJ7539487.1 hypothetical protein O6H91_11G095800 [Diphasiastrum complanatum]